jgi:hypothetical protein
LDENGKPKPGCFRYIDSETGEIVETESSQPHACRSDDRRQNLKEAKTLQWQDPAYRQRMEAMGGHWPELESLSHLKSASVLSRIVLA